VLHAAPEGEGAGWYACCGSLQPYFLQCWLLEPAVSAASRPLPVIAPRDSCPHTPIHKQPTRSTEQHGIAGRARGTAVVQVHRWLLQQAPNAAPRWDRTLHHAWRATAAPAEQPQDTGGLVSSTHWHQSWWSTRCVSPGGIPVGALLCRHPGWCVCRQPATLVCRHPALDANAGDAVLQGTPSRTPTGSCRSRAWWPPPTARSCTRPPG
jgi:hypothetical protein